MSEERPRPKGNSRQIIDYNHVIGQIGTKGIFCLDYGIVSIARKLLGERGLWRTSYAIDSSNDFYVIPDIAEFEPISAAIAEFLDEGSRDMSCDIVDAIDRLAERLATGCCSGGTTGQIQVGDNYYYGTDTPLDAPTSFGGAGDEFASETEYENHKCLAATSIVNAIYADLQVLGALSSFQFIASGGLAIAALSGLLAIPALPLILAMAALGLATGLLIAIKDAADFDELKCILYNSDSAVAAYDAIKENLTEVGVSLWGVGFTADIVADFIVAMANIDVLNGLFKQFTYFDDGQYDCSDCEPQPEWELMWGSGPIQFNFNEQVDFQTAFDGVENVVALRYIGDNPRNFLMDFVSIPSGLSTTAGNVTNVAEQDVWTYASGQAPLMNNVWTAYRFNLRFSQSGTVSVVIGEV